MLLTIDIPKRIYDRILRTNMLVNSDRLEVTNAIIAGTPLPKGHGRLADIDATILKIDNLMKDRNIDIRDSTILRATRIWFNNIPTVLEADKDEEQKFCDVNTVVADQFKGTNSNWTECHNDE